MRSLAALALFLVLTAPTVAPAATAAVRPPGAGERAPDFNLRDENGARVRLSALRGKKVVVVFYRGYW